MSDSKYLFVPNDQTHSRIKQMVRDMGLPDDYWLTYRDRVEAVERRGVVRAAGRYLDAGALVIVVVGDARKVGSSLGRFGSVRPWRLTP